MDELELMVECQRLIFKEWSEAAEAMLLVRTEVDDKSPDWNLFHRARVTSAQERLLRQTQFLDAINERVKNLTIGAD